MKISIPTPRDFSFKRTMLSHGWCTLLPCERDEESWILRRVFDLDGVRPVSARIRSSTNAINIEIPQSKLGTRSTKKITRDVRHMFRLDDDMTEFYEIMSADPSFEWIARARAGRMLRSPTVFEDLVKTICTTNCAWGATSKMVSVLTNSLGCEAADGRRAFPTPDAMASAPKGFFRNEVRAGYRSGYLRVLAERVTSGTLDVESWLDSELPTEELKREIKSVKGVGDYAAENLLKLVGRYEGLALDSWLRARFAQIHNKGRACSDKKIARHYARFGRWRGLALWCDMTRDWIEEQSEGRKAKGEST